MNSRPAAMYKRIDAMKQLVTGFRLVLLLVSVSALAEPLPMNKIAEGVYVHVGKHHDFDEHYDGDIANIGFVVGSQSVAIIDTGGAFKVGAALREAVRSVTELPIRYVINTHVHPDHIFGNAAFEQDHPVFIGHAKLPATLELNRDNLMRELQKELGNDADGSKVIAPTQIVTDTMDLDLGGRTLHLQAWPKAHTNTDLTVLDHKTSTFWTGDLLFITRTPSLDGDLKGWISVINELKAIQAKVTIPGHGDPTEAKNEMLDKEQAYMNLLLADVRSAIKNGVGLMEAINTVGRSEKGKWVLFETVNPRNVNLAYPQLEWE
jgi:quinoprotein relay system zinc metallohydrolase 2